MARRSRRCINELVRIPNYFSVTSTLTSRCPSKGAGTTMPSLGLPFTLSETWLPSPSRLTVMR